MLRNITYITNSHRFVKLYNVHCTHKYLDIYVHMTGEWGVGCGVQQVREKRETSS